VDEQVRGREYVYKLLADQAMFCCIKLENKSPFLVIGKYGKETLRQAIEGGYFNDDEIEAIGKQIEETNELRRQEERQRERRFAQYIEDIKANIVRKQRHR